MDHGTTEQANGEPLEDGELDDGEGPQPDPSLLQDTAMVGLPVSTWTQRILIGMIGFATSRALCYLSRVREDDGRNLPD